MGFSTAKGPIPSSDHCMRAVNSTSLVLPPEMLDEEEEGGDSNDDSSANDVEPELPHLQSGDKTVSP